MNTSGSVKLSKQQDSCPEVKDRQSTVHHNTTAEYRVNYAFPACKLSSFIISNLLRCFTYSNLSNPDICYATGDGKTTKSTSP
jgi:hypothetical protein